MPRSPRNCPAGIVFHVLNRANSRNRIFNEFFDYQSFIKIVIEAQQKYPSEILSYCLMPNHWHFLIRPTQDEELSQFIGWITNTHTRRFRSANKSWGEGSLYQGRFKSFPVKNDRHCLIVKRYIERNPLRANLVSNAQEWLWSSLGQAKAEQLSVEIKEVFCIPKEEWIETVNKPQSEVELQALRASVKKGSPYGDHDWILKTAEQIGLQSTLKQVGRPKILKADNRTLLIRG
ncbi:MAG: transposase [Oligoflexales bacterium]|nr:transposase [Oligoflexales bacterium]